MGLQSPWKGWSLVDGTINRLDFGILVIIKGTHSPIGQAQSDAFVSGLKRRVGPGVPVVMAYLKVQKPNLPMVFRMMDTLNVRRWLCVPLFAFASDDAKFAKYVREATHFMDKRRDLELFWMSSWGAKSQLISLAAGAVSQMLLDYSDNPRILLIGGASNSVKTFHNYEESANRISRLVGEGIEACVLTGVGNLAKEVLERSLGRLESVLLVPYVSFEGLLLQNLHQVVQKGILSRRQHVTQTGVLFVQQSVTQYVYTAIENRLYQEGIRDRVGYDVFAQRGLSCTARPMGWSLRLKADGIGTERG